MDTPTSLPIAELRAMAAAEREAGEAQIRKANEIDAHIDALLKLVAPQQPAAPAQPVLALATTSASPSRVFASSAPADVEQGSPKSARYGIVTGKWLRVLRVLAETAEREPFALTMASDAVKQEQGKERRLAEIRRQFEPYLEAGYLLKAGDDQYQFTDKGFKKVGFAPDRASVEHVAEENEASVADATNASETALRAQDRRPPE